MADKKSNSNKNRLAGIILLYFIGILTGAVMYCMPPDGQAERFEIIVKNFISGRFGKAFPEIFINSFCEPFVMLLICFFLGLSAVAHPVEYLVPVFHALGTGITLAGIYDMYGINGISMSAVMIIPGTVISSFAVIIASREALNMSTDICSSSFRKVDSGVKIDFKLYFTKFVILCVIVVIASVVESLMVFLFEDLWKV